MAVVLLLACGLVLWRPGPALLPHRHSSTILVLDDCEPDFRQPRPRDRLVALRPNGTATPLFTNFNICQTIGGCRMVAVAPDASFFVAAENVGNRLVAATLDGKVLWEKRGHYQSAAIAPSGKVYALTSTGKIYGAETVVFEPGGQISRTGSVSAFDLALDPRHQALWLAGKDVKRCDLDLNVLTNFTGIGWCASSIDAAPDGSAWVAERQHPDVRVSTNRLFQISTNGALVRVIGLGWSPTCVRVDHSDGSIWATGAAVSKSIAGRLLEAIENRTGKLPLSRKRREAWAYPRVERFLAKFSANGKLLCERSEGGHTLDLDQADGSVWVASESAITHFARDGRTLGRVRGTSSEQRTIAVAPRPVPATPPNARSP